MRRRSKKQSDKIGVTILIILVIIFIFSGFLELDTRTEIKEYGRYTIGYTTQVFYKKGVRWIRYVYYVGGVKYQSNTGLSRNVVYPNGRYYVHFSSKNPKNEKFLDKRPVPESIREVPDDGWATIPE